MPVYVIQAGEGGPCKIGHTTNVASRLSSMQTATHVALRLVAVYEGGQPEEAALHKQFAEVRLKGEWFNLDPDEALKAISLARITQPALATPGGPSERRPPQADRRPYLIALMDDAGLEPVGMRRIGPGYYDAELTRMTNAFSEKRGGHVIGIDLVTWPNMADRRLRIARSFVRTTTEPRSEEQLDKNWIPPIRERSAAEEEARRASLEASLEAVRRRGRRRAA